MERRSGCGSNRGAGGDDADARRRRGSNGGEAQAGIQRRHRSSSIIPGFWSFVLGIFVWTRLSAPPRHQPLQPPKASMPLPLLTLLRVGRRGDEDERTSDRENRRVILTGTRWRPANLRTCDCVGLMPLHHCTFLA